MFLSGGLPHLLVGDQLYLFGHLDLLESGLLCRDVAWVLLLDKAFLLQHLKLQDAVLLGVAARRLLGCFFGGLGVRFGCYIERFGLLW